jgi:hypothetical protein
VADTLAGSSGAPVPQTDDDPFADPQWVTGLLSGTGWTMIWRA